MSTGTKAEFWVFRTLLFLRTSQIWEPVHQHASDKNTWNFVLRLQECWKTIFKILGSKVAGSNPNEVQTQNVQYSSFLRVDFNERVTTGLEINFHVLSSKVLGSNPTHALLVKFFDFLQFWWNLACVFLNWCLMFHKVNFLVSWEVSAHRHNLISTLFLTVQSRCLFYCLLVEEEWLWSVPGLIVVGFFSGLY